MLNVFLIGSAAAVRSSLLTAAAGYGTVFLGLLILMVVIRVVGRIMTGPAAVREETAPAPQTQPRQDEDELPVAVMAAAIRMMMDESNEEKGERK